MNILRPPGGFRLTIEPNVADLVNGRIAENAAFGRHWQDILERLRFTAHLEGVADARLGKGYRLWAAAADPDRGLPRVVLVYQPLGAVVRITMASID